MNKIYQSIDAIPDLEFEGYLWYSDAPKPDVVDKDYEIPVLAHKKHPFIIEGNLYHESDQQKISISIKYRDGKYFIHQFNITAAELKYNGNLNPQQYRLHDIKDGKTHFIMFEAWDEVEDPFSDGMKALEPSWTAFGGFLSK